MTTSYTRHANRKLRTGDRVEKNVAHRPGKGTDRGTIAATYEDGSVLVFWNHGSEQRCDRADLRRIR